MGALVEMATSNQLRVLEADASSSVSTFGTCKLHAARPSATSTAMAWLDEEVQARPGKSGSSIHLAAAFSENGQASDLLEEAAVSRSGVVEADASSSVPTFYAAQPSATSMVMAWLGEQMQVLSDES